MKILSLYIHVIRNKVDFFYPYNEVWTLTLFCVQQKSHTGFRLHKGE